MPIVTKAVVMPGMNDLEDRRSSWANIVARLKPGVSRDQAEAAMTPLWRSIRADELSNIKNKTDLFAKHFVAESKLLLLDESRGFSPLREQIQAPLLIVMAMVGLVVLMACVNVSSLLLVRAAARVKEMSIRYAMGAGRGQIIRQLLVEGLLLGLLGGLMGLLFAPLVSAFLVRRIAGDTATEMPFSAHLDLRILLFNFGLAFLVSVLFSLAPALRFLHPDLVNSLKQQATTGSGGHLRFRRVSGRRADWPEPVAADWRGTVRPDAAQPAVAGRRIRHRSSADLRHRSHAGRLRSEAGRPLAETSARRFCRRSRECARSPARTIRSWLATARRATSRSPAILLKPDEDTPSRVVRRSRRATSRP